MALAGHAAAAGRRAGQRWGCSRARRRLEHAGRLWVGAGNPGLRGGVPLLAVPLLPRLGPLAVSLYSSLLAGIALLVTAVLLNGAAAFRMPQAAEAWAIGISA